MSDEVLVSHDDGVLTVTINRPAARNAIDRATALSIAQAMAELDSRDDLRVGILTGAHGHFSAGMDLKALLRGESSHVEHRGFGGLVQAPPAKPLIAAVEGYALGGGFEMALSCDLIVAADDACFGLPEVKRGLIAAGGGAMRLPRQMPPRVAMELILTGEMMSAETALRFGLINRIVAKGTALDGARALARSIAANGPLAVMASKRIAHESADWPAEERFQRQREITAPVHASADAREGARAFAEKRAPVWRGV